MHVFPDSTETPPLRATRALGQAGCLEQVFASILVSMKTAMLPASAMETAEESLVELRTRIQALEASHEDLTQRALQVCVCVCVCTCVCLCMCMWLRTEGSLSKGMPR